MEPLALATGGARVRTRARPGWRKLTALTTVAALGCFAPLFILLPLASQAGWLPPNDSLFQEVWGWPWPATDGWSLAADVSEALLVGLAFAWCMRAMLRTDDLDVGWDLRLLPMGIVCAAVWAQPTVAIRIASIPILVVAAWAVGLRHVDGRTEESGGAIRALRRVAGLLGATGLLVVALTYFPLHPLALIAAGRPSGGSSFARDPSRPELLQFIFANNGPTTVIVRAIHPVGTGTSLTNYTAGGLFHALDRAPGRRPGMMLPRGTPAIGAVGLYRAACRPGAPRRVVRLSAIEVRFDTEGIVRTQRFGLMPPVTLRCR